MDPSGMIEYARLSEGSYFGDISILNDLPNYFSYYVDPFDNKPLELLEVDKQSFLKLLDWYPLAKHSFKKRLVNREKIFNSYKIMTLLKILRSA